MADGEADVRGVCMSREKVCVRRGVGGGIKELISAVIIRSATKEYAVRMRCYYLFRLDNIVR